MFTGLIQEIGTIINLNHSGNDLYLTIQCDNVLNDLKIGDSISINGACQTVIEFDNSSFKVFASVETLNVTTFNSFKVGDKVNLERTLRLCDRLDGHVVTGHVDTIAKIVNICKISETTLFSIELAQKYVKQVVQKGSITIDGISLTIANIKDSIVEIAVIPHTLNSTNLRYKNINDFVNVETDILAKYIEKYLLSNNNINSNITMDLLERNGFL